MPTIFKIPKKSLDRKPLAKRDKELWEKHREKRKQDKNSGKSS